MSKEVGEFDCMDDKTFLLWILDEYGRLMYYIARKYLSDVNQCEDIVQESITGLIGRVETLRNLCKPALANYIAVTVRNNSINLLKRQETESNKKKELFERVSENQETKLSLEDQLIRREELERFRTVWLQLAQDDRRLLEGKYFLGYDDRRLAELFNCNPDSIRMKLTRARRRAFKLIKEGEKNGCTR